MAERVSKTVKNQEKWILVIQLTKKIKMPVLLEK